MKLRLHPTIALVFVAVSIQIQSGDKERKEQAQAQALANQQGPLVSSQMQQPGSPAAPGQNPTRPIPEEPKAQEANQQQPSQPRNTFQEQLELSLKQLKAAFPQEKIPALAPRKEQVAQLSFLSRCLDNSALHSYSHENYLRSHVHADTLRVALATADAQRSKFGHAANELVRKARERQNIDLVKRMGELIAWSNAYEIGLNEDDLRLMRAIAIESISTAVGTLILLDQKSTGIKDKIAATLDIPASKEAPASRQPGQQQPQS